MIYIMEVAIEAANPEEATAKAERIAKGRDFNTYGLPEGSVSGGKMPNASPDGNPNDDTIPNTWEPEEHKLGGPNIVIVKSTYSASSSTGNLDANDTSGF